MTQNFDRLNQYLYLDKIIFLYELLETKYVIYFFWIVGLLLTFSSQIKIWTMFWVFAIFGRIGL